MPEIMTMNVCTECVIDYLYVRGSVAYNSTQFTECAKPLLGLGLNIGKYL